MYFGGERLGTKKTKKTFFLIDLNESVFFGLTQYEPLQKNRRP